MSFQVKNVVKGTTYIYESIGVWDKEKKQTRHKRKCIGKLDPDTGELIPSKRLLKPTICRDFGTYYFLNEITEKCGLTEVLKSVFPKIWKEILTCAFFELCEKKAMYLCEEWNDLSSTPCAKTLTSQRISELFKEISFDSRIKFFKKWGKKRAEQEYVAFDITSISSYSKLIEMVEMGYNRDGEDLPQINMGMLFGETSLLPIYYNIYPGSIRDVSTLSNMLDLVSFLNIKGVKFVMDKGFYSSSNVDSMLSKRYNYKFSIAVPFTSSFAKNAVDSVRELISLPSNALLINNQVVQGVTYSDKWKNKKMHVHVIFNKDKYILEEKAFLKKILMLEQEILSGNRVESHENQYSSYFKIRKSRSGLKIDKINENILKALKYKGFCVIISNDIKNTAKIIETYRNKDVVEKSFDNLKNELDLSRLRIHSDSAMDGRIFVAFISLILQSHIHKIMKEKDLYTKYTKEKLLYEMKKIKKIEFSDEGQNIITEISKNQREIFEAFGITLPSK
jgi:transposase